MLAATVLVAGGLVAASSAWAPYAWAGPAVGPGDAVPVASVPGGLAARAPSAGRTGGCTSADADAVTVVIDYGPLGGGVATYCASGLRSGAVAMDALNAVGLSITGTTQYGQSTVCRINGLPGPTQHLGVAGDPTYTESCVNMPPTSAYWAQWHAPSGGAWTYSSAGALGQRLDVGGFTGWVFELNKTMATSTPPPVSPVTPQAPAAPTAAKPAQAGAAQVGLQAPANSAAGTGAGQAGSAGTGTSGTNSSLNASSGPNPASATPIDATLSQSAPAQSALSPAAASASGSPASGLGQPSLPADSLVPPVSAPGGAGASTGPGVGTVVGLVVVGVLVVAGIVVGLVKRRRSSASSTRQAPRP